MRMGLTKTAIFGDLSATSSESSEIKPAVLYGDILCYPLSAGN